MLDDLRKPAPPSAKPAEKPAAEVKPGAEAPPAEEKPTGEETPAGEEPKAEGAPIAEDEPGEEGDADLPVTPLTAKRAHLRLPPENDQVGRLALGFLKRNRDWTLKQATEAAESQLGIKPEPVKAAEVTKGAEPETVTKVPGLPASVVEIDSETERLEDEKAKASADLRFEDAAKIERQLRKLDRHRAETVLANERATAEKASKAEAAYNQNFDASNKRATELYDFAAQPESEGAKRMVEIEEALRTNGDPLYHSPNKPLVIAQMVARELRVPPKTAKSPTKTVPGKPVVAAPVTAKPKSVIAEGGATTTPSTAKDQQGKFAETLDKVRNVSDFKKVAASLGIHL